MGLTKNSVGVGAFDSGIRLRDRKPSSRVIALAGNPNVGKSTVFNGLTGMNQHTGNWPGKTVACATGVCSSAKNEYVFVDIPGTYSLLAHSPEEEVARDFLCFGDADAAVVVCDATCPERNLNLVLQIMETGIPVLVCLNLMDEAGRRGIRIDTEELQRRLGVPVIPTVARRKRDLRNLLSALDGVIDAPGQHGAGMDYGDAIEGAIRRVEEVLRRLPLRRLSPRWLALHLLCGDASLLRGASEYLGDAFSEHPELPEVLEGARAELRDAGIGEEELRDRIVSRSVGRAEEICRGIVVYGAGTYSQTDRKIDRILTGKRLGYPLMLLLLAFVFFLTVTVANYPSEWLSSLAGWLEDLISDGLRSVGTPEWLRSLLCDGVFRVVGWVVSVMLPPMAIFFPFFTFLEDVGYLPRIAYNLDRPFHACKACGKQALTMCMGFGCNAAGIVGCRIIDSPRERLLAILTNSFVPCNGRFPALLALLGMFLVGASGGVGASVSSALLLTLLILIGILMTFAVTALLSATLLRGTPSAFTLELPPYRRPQIGKIIVRSIFDRTLFVLGRSVAVAAPAGLILWVLANVSVGGGTLLSYCTAFLDPVARPLGMDGVILMAFILGFPANEIVIPIITMAYLSGGSLGSAGTLAQTRELFLANGWTWVTAVSVLIFFLMHWPCSTTLLTVRKETGSWKWTALAALLPTAAGVVLCLLFNAAVRLFQ